MNWLRYLVIFLALIQAGFMIFFGGHALLTGEFLTPKTGPFQGRLGPWQGVVESLGIPARSVWMKLIFMSYGALILFACIQFARCKPWGRVGLLLVILGSFWWLGPATPLVFTTSLLLLLLPAQRVLAPQQAPECSD